MRPLRLLLDGFGSYREPAEIDFSDVSFFALVGPTGAGKSTVIDGLCFALYGTVPRWGKENAIAQALAPAANACWVSLVFEAAGKRYGIARALTRDARGQVHTKEARLELLDPALPPDAPLADLLAASVEALAEGPDQVKAQVQDILGLTYEHFTQSVLLPQGRFAEFLHAKAAQRQDLLVELLAFGVYNTVGQRARERAKLAASRMQAATSAREELAAPTADAEMAAAARVAELTDLSAVVDDRLTALAELTGKVTGAAEQATQGRAALTALAAVRAPAEVPGLALRIAAAEQALAERRKQRDDGDDAEVAAQQAREALGDKTRLELLATAYRDQADVAARLERQEADHAACQASAGARATELETAKGGLSQAREDQARAEREHAAAALAQHLHAGEPCPVCLQPVTAVRAREVPADLAVAAAAVEAAEQQVSQRQAAHNQANAASAGAASVLRDTRQQLAKVRETLTDAPGEAEVTAALDAVGWADATLGQAVIAARAARSAYLAAEQQRASLSTEEGGAWAGLRRSRDSVIALGAPELGEADLAAQWDALASWARSEHAERERRQAELDASAADLRQRAADETGALARLLTEHGITEIITGNIAADSGGPSPRADLVTGAAAAVATHRLRAANWLADIRDRRAKAASMDEQIRAHREEGEVATELGRLLRANSFEGWLCGEALDALVAEASRTLMELSGGQYQLDRDERNDLKVIDYQDAGASRPVHTLSGGETFQASLALALALSRQVIGLSAGMRDLNSMFLDEGFGTLDEDTLEAVGTTLERLAADSDRMIGIITHVPALAERVPVRFVVSRTGATSALRKEQVA